MSDATRSFAGSRKRQTPFPSISLQRTICRCSRFGQGSTLCFASLRWVSARMFYRPSLLNRKLIASQSRSMVGPDASGSHASTYWHNTVAIGDVLEAVGPTGSFHLPDRLDRPLAVISAGIGEAPMTAIAEELAVRAPHHRAWFLHGTTNGATFALKGKLGFLRSDLPNSQWRIWYSRPRSSDRQDRDYNILGQLVLVIFDQLQPTNEFDFYACGADEFVASTTSSLRKLGIPGSRIKTEALGRAGEVDLEVVGEDIDVAPLEPRTINFIRSGKRATWTPNHGSILEFAEYLGLAAAFSCRTGMCGKCAQRIVSGHVIPIRKTHAIPCEGHQLMCSNVPDSDLVIDL